MAKSKAHYGQEYTNMEELLQCQKNEAKDVRGYTTHTKIIEQVTSSTPVKELINTTYKLIPELTKRDVKVFTIGASEAREQPDEEFDIKDISTWVVEGGLKARWNRMKYDYDGLIVLATADVGDDLLLNQFIRDLDLYCEERYGDSYIYSEYITKEHKYKVVLYMAYVLTRSKDQKTAKHVKEYRTVFKQYKSSMELVTRSSKDYEKLLTLQQRSTYEANLLDHEEINKYTQLASALVEHTKQVITDIETKSTKKIMKFVIGQTFARRRKRLKKFLKFDPLEFETWRLDGGVNGRWNHFYGPEGYDGLIALCAITSDTIPPGIKDTFKWMDQIECAKALEQRLIQYFMLKKLDARVANTSFHTGKRPTPGSAYAGVVYLAYMLSDTPNSDYSLSILTDLPPVPSLEK